MLCMGSLWVLQLLPRIVTMHLGIGKFARLHWPKKAGIGSSIWYIHGQTDPCPGSALLRVILFSLYLLHTSAFATLWLPEQFTHNTGHSSATVLPGGPCIMGSSPSLRLSYFGGETQRKVLTVCFKWDTAWLPPFHLVPPSSVLPSLFKREAAIIRRAIVYKASFSNDLCHHLLGGFVSYVTPSGPFTQNWRLSCQWFQAPADHISY